MNKAQALYSFWSSFGYPAYDANTVPEDATFPRITYESVTDSFNNTVLLSASIWDRNLSWVRSEEISSDISDIVGDGGLNVAYDGGMIWIRRGTPFAQRLGDPDDSIRRILINLEAEYIGG